jgi:PmbA protein
MNIPELLDRTTKAQWEVFTQHSRKTDIQIRQGVTEAVINRENKGYGIRVIVPRTEGAGIGFASCNSEEELEATARKAHDLAKLNRSPFFKLPTKKKLPSVQTVDRKILRDQEGVVRDYAEATQALISKEKDISLTFGKIRTCILESKIINSQGVACESKGTYLYLEMTFKIGRSNPTEYWPTRYARRVSDMDATKIIPRWLQIARSCLKRRAPKTTETTVIFSPTMACDIFVPTIGFHSSAEAVKLNLSQFSKGAKIGSDQLSVDDDGLFPFGLRTNAFDDEGQPQKKTRIIEKGVFKEYLYDQLHAQTMHAKPTGNGIRPKWFAVDVDERYQLLPENRTTNLSIKPGSESFDSIIQGVKDGLIIHQPAWLNPDEITTRFGAEIRNAQEIKNGELGEGIVGGTVSGSALELMQRISGISNKAEVISAYCFGCVAPYIRCDNVRISGPA